MEVDHTHPEWAVDPVLVSDLLYPESEVKFLVSLSDLGALYRSSRLLSLSTRS